ncbi:MULTISPECIES: hypothetical protein [unclassified Pseudoalteromonas]|uniref:hypothetical protein n=1 Tax=unclassified Pseudoalteromonas TaxID=194690 RepID=UPI001F218F15|nr:MULTISPECIES: hypothetical protein [unclassified Pseudoalteromonas]MCF2827097.1 hypothetical protein [Pseudoalteromonas sp. OF5H-5]MCF2834473.1 hypothetical protein [Pseudoalteromonas sp. DL2-H6]MCF2925890.1 hypothetical protein [Pseudoalteromonas sp. DL2-H1]
MVDRSKFERLDESQQRIVKFIVDNLDKEVLEQLENAIHVEYARDVSYVLEHRPDVANRAKPQMHRYAVDQVFVDMFGPDALQSTEPRGEYYTIYSNGAISMSHCEAHTDEKKRPAKHRKKMAKKNEVIEPLQLTFEHFDNTQKRAVDNTIHIALYTLHKSKVASDATEPEGIYVVVPYSDWTGYHLFVSLQLILGMYGNEELEAMEDMAMPALKDVMIDREKDIFKR